MKRTKRGHKTGRSRRRGGRAWLVAALTLLGLAAFTLAAAFWFWTRKAGPPGPPIAVQIAPETSLEELVAELERAGLVRDRALFELYLRLHGKSSVRRGDHWLPAGATPRALAARLTESRQRPIVKLTIPEGFNRFQIAERLAQREICGDAAFIAASADPAQLQALGVEAATAEGYLFPATYELYADSSAALVTRTLVQEALRRFERITREHSAQLSSLRTQLGFGTHELLTLASIVEKEAAHPSEHGLIASVFYNRLRDPQFFPRRMLQSDPTAGYGCLLARDALPSCQGYAGAISPAMLRDGANPYNTYKHPGLPPGPIANPGASALLAVINPPNTPYFFFFSRRGERHVFSRTLAEHDRVIAEAPPGAGAAKE